MKYNVKILKIQKAFKTLISEKLVEIYEAGEENLTELNMQPKGELTVILFVGVNGVGKTTTIGKLSTPPKIRRKIGDACSGRYIPCGCD